MGRGAAGVTGMRIRKGDIIISMDVIPSEVDTKNLEVLVVTENGLGKKSELGDYKVQKRAGSGIKTLKVTAKTGKIVSMSILNAKEEHDLMVISQQGQTLRTQLGSISTLGRATQGVRIIRLDGDDKVASATII
jgi:DNA gyrase subunit A